MLAILYGYAHNGLEINKVTILDMGFQITKVVILDRYFCRALIFIDNILIGPQLIKLCRVSDLKYLNRKSVFL